MEKLTNLVKKLIVIAYIRVSTKRQAQDGMSLKTQEEDIRKYCELHGYELVRVFADEGESGKDENREQFTEMKDYIDENDVDMLVVWKTSRFGRNFNEYVSTLAWLEERNCRLVSIKDRFDSSEPSSKLPMYIHGMLADFERDNIQVQVTDNLYSRAEDGEFNGGIAPFGYNHLKEKKALVVNEEEAEVVKGIFESYLNGFGYSKIADNVNLEGYRTKKNNRFGINNIKTILTNPIYTGKIRYGYHQDWAEKRRKGRSDNYVLVEGKHQGIVSDEIFKEVQHKIESNPKRGNTGMTSNYLLSGLLRCPYCGYGMVGQKTKSKNKEYYYYVCGGYKNKRGCNQPHSNLMAKMDKDFINAIQRYFSNINLDTITECMKQEGTEKQSKYEQRVKNIKNNIRNLKVKKNNVMKAFEEENAPISVLTEALNKTIGEIEKSEEKLKTIEIENSNRINKYDPIIFYQNLTLFSQLFGIASPEEKRQLVEILVSEVILDKNFEIKKIVFKFGKTHVVQIFDQVS